MEVPQFRSGWLYPSRSGHHLRRRAQHGEAGNGRSEAATEQATLLPSLLRNFPPSNIYTCGESGLFWKSVPSSGVSARTVPGHQKSNGWITVHFCCNADGSDKPPLWFVGKHAHPRAFTAANTNIRAMDCHWRANGKAWMDRELFEEWLLWFNRRVAPRHVILLMGNTSAHRSAYEGVKSSLTHVLVCWLPPDTTRIYQPLDQGIVRTFKAYYRRKWLQSVLDESEQGHNPRSSMNVLKAVRWSINAWDHVGTATIIHCWSRSTLVPRPTTTSGGDRIPDINAEVRALVQQLQRRALIPEAVDIHRLIDPSEETVVESTEDTEQSMLGELQPQPAYESDEEMEIIPPIPIHQALYHVQQLQLYEEQQIDGSPDVVKQLNQLEELLCHRRNRQLQQSPVSRGFR